MRTAIDDDGCALVLVGLVAEPLLDTADLLDLDGGVVGGDEHHIRMVTRSDFVTRHAGVTGIGVCRETVEGLGKLQRGEFFPDARRSIKQICMGKARS